VRELAALISHDSESKSPVVIINCMTPGACKSDFNREAKGIGAIVQNLVAAIIARTTEAGSRALVDGVAVGEESHGSYMENCQIREYVFSCLLILGIRKKSANILI
jgi:retinol dehydrogenase-12